eukprot:CAMPEP_0185805760 /NCGR_PEP_ID=MMETSP1322-20130828/4050_1 /TAXON_ID=265543 /ORGANISM="Minutocellus polymorphus, Strain RCC2270" /LENGTH=309 /DNA_ID=CAMNT_0028501815 /DNA_START=111 /DNA_END=1040 /DNA_ORIENTATION=+
MRTCITLLTTALLLGASATTAFPARASSSRAMPKNAPVNADVAGGRGQDRRQLSSKEIGAAFGLGLRGGAVESVAAASSSTSLSAGIGLVEACGLAAPIASIFVSLSPFPTVQKILREKSVGDLPVLPYSSLVANCFIWMTYGILKSEPKVWSCNSFSTILGIYYLFSFAKHSPKASPTLPGSIAMHFKAAIGTILATLAVAVGMPKVKAANILGSAGVGICIALFASPLAALKTVFKTKSAEAIPLPFAIAATVNCVLWFIVGWIDMKDVNIWLPNGLGLLAGLFQIALKLFYGDGDKLKLAEAKQAA